MRLTTRSLIGPDENTYPMRKTVIKTIKENDLKKKNKKYISSGHAPFYNEMIYQWPSTENKEN